MTIDDFYDLLQRLRIRHDRTNSYIFLDHKDCTGGNIIGACVVFKRTIHKQTIVLKVNFWCRSPEMDEVRMHCILNGIEVLGHVYARDPSPLEKQLYEKGRYRDNRAKFK